MISLHNTIDTFYDEKVSCMFSDDNAKELIFRIKLEVPQSPNAANATEVSDDMLTDLKALEFNIMETLVIKGIKNVERAELSQVKSRKYNQLKSQGAIPAQDMDRMSEFFDSITNQFYMDQEWVIFTDGSNLREILALDIIDAARTVTNNINEIYEVLGIEAARQSLFNEISEVLDSIYVNYRHIALLVDVMTNKGNILSVNRHGINRGDIGPLAKCSFEETTDKLIKAGMFAEFDKINGVAANVMLGQIAPCGTGDVDVLIDEEMLTAIAEGDDEDDDDVIEDKLVKAMCTEHTMTIGLEVPAFKDDFMAKDDNKMVFID
jgi:DNA-directed RNA polymerase II subunit RPB1